MMKSWLEIAAEYHDNHRPADYPLDFGHDVAEYLRQHYVLSTRDVFAMARPMRLEDGLEFICDPFASCPEDEADTLHVHLVAGNIRHLFDACPIAPRNVAFLRLASNNVRTYDFHDIKKRVLGREG